MAVVFLQDLVRLTDLAVLYADAQECSDREAALFVEDVFDTHLKSVSVFMRSRYGGADEVEDSSDRADWLCDFTNSNWWRDQKTGEFASNRTAAGMGQSADDLLVRREDVQRHPELKSVADIAPKATEPPFTRPPRIGYIVPELKSSPAMPAPDFSQAHATIEALTEERDRLRAELTALKAAPTPSVAPDDTLDPADLPDELDNAMQAFRAVHNGYGTASESFRNRLIAWIAEHRPDLGTEARKRIATVSNLDKAPGRKPRREE